MQRLLLLFPAPDWAPVDLPANGYEHTGESEADLKATFAATVGR